MGRKRQPERVLGPYLDERRGTWYVIHVAIVDGRSSRTSRSFETEGKAEAHASDLRALLAEAEDRTIGEARDEYLRHQRAKKLREKTITGNTTAINLFFEDEGQALANVTPTACAARHRKIAASYSVDHQRNVLSQAKAFLAWCVGEGWIRANPAAGLKGVGKRRKGKAQLRVDEARKWSAKAFELAPRWPGAVAALMALYLDLRTGEIVRAQVRDLDDGGKVLWVGETKSEAGRRVLEVPKELLPLLVALAKDRAGSLPLLGAPHAGLWVTRWVQRICDLAGVPPVCAQAMRGLHASIAVERGATSHLIARAMGHASPKVTMAHYAKPEAQRRGRQRAALKLLRGGKG